MRFPSAEALGYFRGRFPALRLVGARPVEQKKGADGGVDGKVFFRDHPDAKAKPQVIIFSVKGGSLKLDDVRALDSVVKAQDAARPSTDPR